ALRLITYDLSLTTKIRIFYQAHLMYAVLQRGCQNSQAVSHATAEIDGRGFLKIFGGTGHFGYIKSGHKYLGGHLVVEYKIIRIGFNVYASQNLGTKGSVAGMVF